MGPVYSCVYFSGVYDRSEAALFPRGRFCLDDMIFLGTCADGSTLVFFLCFLFVFPGFSDGFWVGLFGLGR